MYDTLHFWLPAHNISANNFLKEIPRQLNDATIHCKGDGTNYFTGKTLGVNVSFSEKGISLKGSICKSYFNNNLQTLTRIETQKAIENLEDELHLKLKDAKVCRIDFAQNLTLNYKPEIYYSYLGYSQRYKRFENDRSIYYQNGMRSKVFYNKIAELKNSREKIPTAFVNQNILRYELRLKNRLPNQFNKPEITVKDLYCETFYLEMVNRWVNEYQEINKTNLFNFNLENMKQPKDFFEQLLLQKMSEVGQPKLLAMVDEIKARNLFPHNEYYSRLKREIKKQCNPKNHSQTSELVLELDKKISEVKLFCK